MTNASSSSSARALVDLPAHALSSREARPDMAAHSRRGRSRRENQDQYLIADLERAMLVRASGLEASRNGPRVVQGQVLAVADGVGGREGGRLASSVAVRSVSRFLLEATCWHSASAPVARLRSQQVERDLESAMHDAQRRLRSAARLEGVDPRLATTLTMAYVCWPGLVLAHAGDSRGYLLRRGELHRLTRDHTVAEALLESTTDLDRAAVEARWGHVLDNVVGGSSDDLVVDVERMDLEPGDRLLLCTDGLTAYLDDGDLHRMLGEPRSAEEQVATMVQSAMDRGGHDDTTVVLAAF